MGSTVHKINCLLFSHTVWKVEGKWQDSYLCVSLCNVSMKKTSSLANPEAAMESFVGYLVIFPRLKQMQLQLLSSVSWGIWGSAREMARYWRDVCCALLKSRCVRMWFKNTLKLRWHIDHFKWEGFGGKLSSCSDVPWCRRTVFFQKSLLCAIKTTGVISQNLRNPVNLSCVWVCSAAEWRGARRDCTSGEWCPSALQQHFCGEYR